MAGNTLGVRRYYLYTSDVADTQYSFLTDKDLGDAASNDLNDQHSGFPRRFTPRGVYCQATIDNKLVRKFVICGKKDSSLLTNGSQDVQIDGETFKTTGRRGESYSFGGNPAGTTPAPGDGGGTDGGGTDGGGT